MWIRECSAGRIFSKSDMTAALLSIFNFKPSQLWKLPTPESRCTRKSKNLRTFVSALTPLIIQTPASACALLFAERNFTTHTHAPRLYILCISTSWESKKQWPLSFPCFPNGKIMWAPRAAAFIAVLNLVHFTKTDEPKQRESARAQIPARLSTSKTPAASRVCNLLDARGRLVA